MSQSLGDISQFMAEPKIVNRSEAPGRAEHLPLRGSFAALHVRFQGKAKVGVEIARGDGKQLVPIDLVQQRGQSGRAAGHGRTRQRRQKKLLLDADYCLGFHGRAEASGEMSDIKLRRTRARRFSALEMRRARRISKRMPMRTAVSSTRFLQGCLGEPCGMSANFRHCPLMWQSVTRPRTASAGTGKSHQE